jgi:hypothetical protein
MQLSVIQSKLQGLLKRDSYANNGFYTVRSMYFDNYENRCFYENENGVEPREKYRIRIYNVDNTRISLECKRKEYGMTNKTSCLISQKQYSDIINGRVLLYEKTDSALLRKFLMQMKTQLFRPTVIVEYERTPFVYDIGNVRITIDRNIRSSDRYSEFFKDRLASRVVLPQGQQLLEVKYNTFLPPFILDVLQTGELQQTTFSKFYLCRSHSLGGS